MCSIKKGDLVEIISDGQYSLLVKYGGEVVTVDAVFPDGTLWVTLPPNDENRNRLYLYSKHVKPGAAQNGWTA